MYIFPADAGVNLIVLPKCFVKIYIPRGCGGEPVRSAAGTYQIKYSPRMRG